MSPSSSPLPRLPPAEEDSDYSSMTTKQLEAAYDECWVMMRQLDRTDLDELYNAWAYRARNLKAEKHWRLGLQVSARRRAV